MNLQIFESHQFEKQSVLYHLLGSSLNLSFEPHIRGHETLGLSLWSSSQFIGSILGELAIPHKKWNQALSYHPSTKKWASLSLITLSHWSLGFNFFFVFLFNFLICYCSIPMGMGVFFCFLLIISFCFLVFVGRSHLNWPINKFFWNIGHSPNKKHIGVSISSPLPKIKSQRWFVLTHLYNLCTWKFNF